MRWKLGLLLWAASMIGIVVLCATMIPQVAAAAAATRPLPIPLWAMGLISVAQNAVVLALAVWAGVRLAGRVGLHAPLFEAAAARAPLAPALRPQLLPGLAAGIAGGIFLVLVSAHAPATLGSK